MNVRFAALLTGVCAIALCDVNTADAFYWRNWPGSGVTTTTNTVASSPQTSQVVTTPVVVDPVDPGPSDPVDPGPTDPETAHAPEPTTLVGGLIGLGFVAMLRGRRQRKLESKA